MGSVYDDLPGHEGYAVRDENNLWVPTCACGWSDEPYGDDYDAAVDRWDTAHARPLLERAVPFDIAELVEDARRALVGLVDERPQAAALALDSINRWAAVLRQRTGVEVAGPSVSERLDALQHKSRRSGRRLGR